MPFQPPAAPPAYIAALVVPPASVGTCMPARTPSDAAGRITLHGRRLVMSTRVPDGRREITVYMDKAGRVRRYVEMVHHATGRSSSIGENVFAIIGPDGSVRGMRSHGTTTIDLPANGRLDTIKLRTLSDRATTNLTRAALTVQEQTQLRTTAAWLVRRCQG